MHAYAGWDGVACGKRGRRSSTDRQGFYSLSSQAMLHTFSRVRVWSGIKRPCRERCSGRLCSHLE